MNKCEALIRYMSYLSDDLGYQISIKDFIGFISKDPDTFETFKRYYIHCLPFCSYVKFHHKSIDEACQRNTKLLERQCRSADRPFMGMCFCGIWEIVIPVKYEETLLAAICIGGFYADRDGSMKRLEANGIRHQLREEEMCTLRRKMDESCGCWNYIPEELNTILAQTEIVAEQMRLLYLLLSERGVIKCKRQYFGGAFKQVPLSMAIEYISMHFTEPITLEDVAKECRCSTSYISHMFNRYMGYNVKTFINMLRINKARELLVNPHVRVTDVALECGYSDSNYFSTMFKKITGDTPSGYRNRQLKEMETTEMR